MSTAKLLAIVSVESSERVRCGEVGCGHSVYRAIHVVKDSDGLLVLGSTCFAKRFGSGRALGTASFGGGDGRKLTAEERQLLVNNTAELLKRFEAEERQRAEALAVAAALEREDRAGQALMAPALAPTYSRPQGLPAMSTVRAPSWPWVKPNASFGYFKLHDGSSWVRVLHKNGRHILVPWPASEGWDEALPGYLGTPDQEIGGYLLADVQKAVAYLQTIGEPCRVFGTWPDLLKFNGKN